MPNQNLKHALGRAGLTPEQFADIISVDPRTVERWVAGRTPYPRHRATISRALDLTEHELWPEETSAPNDPPARQENQPAADGPTDLTPGEGPLGDLVSRPEVIATWGATNSPGTPRVSAFLADACEQVDVLTAGSGLLRNPGLFDQLCECARNGARVRMHANASTPELEALADHDRVQVRVRDASVAHALLRVDNAMLLILALAGDSWPPLLKLTRRGDGGLFDRLTEHFTACWDVSDPLAATGSPEPSGDTAPRRWPRRGD